MAFANGALLGGPAHREFGHIPVERHPDDDFAGHCPYHAACLESLANASSITARFGDPALMSRTHPGWDVVAWYLAQACQTLFLTVRPERIVLGGGILLAGCLLDRIRDAFTVRMGFYLSMTTERAGDLIVTPGLDDDADLLGGACLALDHNKTGSR